MRLLHQLLAFCFIPLLAQAASPSLQTINDTTWVLSNGDTFDMTINADGYAYSVQWNGRELVRNATGGYVDFGGRTTVNYTQGPEIWEQTDSLLHVNFPSYYADVPLHPFQRSNRTLSVRGETTILASRAKLELFTDGTRFSFPVGRTNCKDAPLPQHQRYIRGPQRPR